MAKLEMGRLILQVSMFFFEKKNQKTFVTKKFL